MNERFEKIKYNNINVSPLLSNRRKDNDIKRPNTSAIVRGNRRKDKNLETSGGVPVFEASLFKSIDTNVMSNINTFQRNKTPVT